VLPVALQLLSRGLSVIPVPRPRAGVPVGQPGDGKVPAIAWREFQSRLPTEAEVHRWFSREPMNLAIVTGEVSNIVAVDADDPAALRWSTRRLPYTPWQTKTSRGYHLFYRHPGIRVANRARLKTTDGTVAVDVRGDGGYVIAPGSIHATGAMYKFTGDWTRDDVPRFWPGWLQRPLGPTRPSPKTVGAPIPFSTSHTIDRARRYLAAIPRPDIGHGSDAATLSAACRLVRGFNLDAADAEALLWEWCGGRPGWTREWVAQKVEHALRYGTEPVGGLIS